MKQDVRALISIFFPLVFLYYLNTWLDAQFSIYMLFPMFDIPMHIAGGIVSARALYLLYLLYKDRLGMRIEPQWMLHLGLIGGVALVAYAWEVYELAWDWLFHTNIQHSTEDLLLDMLLGMFGASVYWLLAHKPK